MILEACCKINIGLDVLRRRPDGYHDLETIMVPVRGLYDIVEVERNDNDTTHFTGKGIVIDCADEDNICLKAYRLMREKFGIGGVNITLDKRVPFGAGLGGGSSDGTAVIMALNDIFSLNLSEQQLIDLAAELGSDTPFFVRCSPQLCEGRGEIMRPIDIDLEGLWIAIVKPDVSISTREAYAGIRPEIPTTPLSQRITAPRRHWQECIKNDFERSIFAAHPDLATIKESLIAAGAVYAAMSGSGSAIFGLFESEASAEAMRSITPYIFKL